MTADGLSRVRKSILPQSQDTWALIAAREMPGREAGEAVAQLQSWNLHIFMRAGQMILPSDVIFVEPPAA